jgi:coproporphyrinogen III oxidase-like Fe-S oxidoreductase
LGIGPGAHGRLALGYARVATKARRSPEKWLVEVEAKGHAVEEEIALARAARIEEMLMMGLRLAEGVARGRFEAEAGATLEGALPAAPLRALIDGGFLVLDRDGLRATPAGRQRLNAVLGMLLRAVPDLAE